MSATWNPSEFQRPANDRSLDRLVDGSLPEAERRTLLLQLESDPDGWRRCALAFLEAQSWREAFAPLVAAASAPAPLAAPVHRAPMRKAWRSVARGAALAACLMAAFSLGWASKPAEITTLNHEVAHASPVLPEATSATFPQTNAEPDLQASAIDHETAPTALESVLKSWEQLGYSAERQKTHVTVRLWDGRELEVPAQEIKLRYTGDRTY